MGCGWPPRLAHVLFPCAWLASTPPCHIHVFVNQSLKDWPLTMVVDEWFLCVDGGAQEGEGVTSAGAAREGTAHRVTKKNPRRINKPEVETARHTSAVAIWRRAIAVAMRVARALLLPCRGRKKRGRP